MRSGAAARMASHIRIGVNGICTSRMPSGATASATALATAARAPTVPASPQPFIPSTFAVDGTGSEWNAIIGTSWARGIP